MKFSFDGADDRHLNINQKSFSRPSHFYKVFQFFHTDIIFLSINRNKRIMKKIKMNVYF